MHQKERVLAPLFESTFGLQCFTTVHLNTDEFGTFSGEIERIKSPLETARQKCLRAVELTSCDLVLASEGSFGAHPVAGFVPMNEELLLFLDVKNNLEIAVKHVSTQTNFGSTVAHNLEDVYAFTEAAKFPEHAVIVREPSGQVIRKGVNDLRELLNIFSDSRQKYDSVTIESDMRAQFNPTRMHNIYNCGKKLVSSIQSKCPECAWPGFSVSKVISGLPCENCSMPTKSTLKHVYVCKCCGFTKEKNNPHGKVAEEAVFCDFLNEGIIATYDVLICDNYIEKIAPKINPEKDYEIIDASGLHLLPGLIDTHVHFREPGYTEKATIASESKAAILGGITTVFDMPNTVPNTLTPEHIEDKAQIAKNNSFVNYGFWLGITANTLQNALAAEHPSICGLTDDGLYFNESKALFCNQPESLEFLFKHSKRIVALHCEDEDIIVENERHFHTNFGLHTLPKHHAAIRSDLACFKATQRVVKLARATNARFHLLHLSSALEIPLLDVGQDVKSKKITAEVCLHHLYFNDGDYERKGHLIKWNPSIKSENDRLALLNAIKNDQIDTIATDHAPHLIEEKQTDYFSAKSGATSIQHVLPTLLTLNKRGEISLQQIVQKHCHNPATVFSIVKRGYIRAGYFADLVLVDLNENQHVKKTDLRYKCGWSPFENETLTATVKHVLVNGRPILYNGKYTGERSAQAVLFSK
eukprot:gene4002-5729_t